MFPDELNLLEDCEFDRDVVPPELPCVENEADDPFELKPRAFAVADAKVVIATTYNNNFVFMISPFPYF